MKKTILLTLLTVLIISFFIPLTVLASEEPKTVRVGWFSFPGNFEYSDGKYSGYTYDYLMEIAKYTDWEYEFIEEDLATCMEMLKNGELDIIGGLQKTEEREKIYDYPDIAYGQTYAVLFTERDSPLQAYDFKNYHDIRVGILKSANTKEILENYSKNNGFTCSIHEYSTSEDIHAALKAGEIDAGTLVSYVATEDTRILAKYSPLSIYLLTSKGNSEILVGLNQSLNYIKINKLYFDAGLYEKYYVAVESIELTKEETAIIQASQNSPIRVGVIDNCAPVSYWDEKNKAFKGLSLEILNTICSRTGLNIEYVPVDLSRWNDAKVPNENSPQLVLGIPLVDGVTDDRDWCFSDSLLNDSLAIVGKTGSSLAWCEDAGTIAVVKNFVMAQTFIKDTFPTSNVIEYSTLEDCLTAVADGKADATVYYQSCILYYLQKPYFNDLKLVLTDMADTSLCVACFTENGKPLLQIINKGMTRISDTELRGLTLNSTMLNTYDMTLMDVFYEYRFAIFIITFLLTAIIIVLIAFYSVKRKSSAELVAAYKDKNEALIEAEKASAAKGNFMSRMSHEIRTPLNAVIGYNTIARNEMTEAKTNEDRRQSEMKVMDCLTKSDIASRHLLTIINDVLDMSAIESGKIKVVRERFDFKGLISSLTAIFYSQSKSKGVDFNVEFATQMEEWIIGDQMRTNQILTNLLSNAIKFTSDEGKVTLFIQPKTTDESIQVHFEVKDTGIGMSEEYLERIWTPFEQADSSISRRFGGTGLGLSITKTLVDLLDGTISVQSKPGEGSTFFVDLTFARTEQPEEKGPYDFSTINALIVDDDVSTCDYIRLLLTRSGVRSSAVYSGIEAINAVKAASLENNPYTICLVDWRMPKMDGLETIKQIRNIVGEELPIIIITAYDFTEVADKAAELGVNMFISKPLFQSSLFNLLANITGSPVPKKDEKLNCYDFSNARVLLAEDNAMNMEIAQKILKSVKLTVDCARDGKEAVTMFFAAPAGTYQAILMDIQMPVMDGYQATRTIRSSEHPEAATIPIIAMTADAFAENIAESHAAGMNAHISKPIDVPLLFRTLKEYL